MKQLAQLPGKTIAKVYYSKDIEMPDAVELVFTDGTLLRIDATLLPGRLFIGGVDGNKELWFGD